MSIKSKLGFNFFDVFVVTFCITFGFICFYPLWYVFLGSINPYDAAALQIPLLLPRGVSFKYYQAIIMGGVFQKAVIVSILKTVVGATGSLIITGMMAYGISKKNIKGMSFLNLTLILTMFFGGGLIPYYFLIRDLKMLDTFWAMVVPLFTNVGNFIIMRNYFSYNVPRELEDSSVIDGANEIIMFFVMVIPISMPMFAAIFLFEAVAHWNDWYSYLIFVDNPNLQPFVWILRKILIDPTQAFAAGQSSQQVNTAVGYIPPANLRMTVIICAMLPIMLLYPFLQKYFAKGIMIGAIKG